LLFATTLFIKTKNPSKEEMAGIRDIIAGLLEEGPVSGIS